MATTEIIKSGCNLPAEVSTEIRRLMTSPADYLKTLPAEKAQDGRPPSAIMLSQMRRGLDRNRQILYVSMLIIEVNNFFNVKGNMNEEQIRLTAELILDNPGFFDLTLGNIKACFRHRMMTEKIYDRIDGNIIIGWLREFKSDMSDWCESTHVAQTEEDASPGAISHSAYQQMLIARAESGDEDAQKILDDYRKRTRVLSPEQMRRKEFELTVEQELYRRDRDRYLDNIRNNRPQPWKKERKE